MIDLVTEYAKKTVNEGKMGELHMLACKRHLEDLKKQGIKFCILSNSNQHEKVKMVAQKLQMPYFYFGTKPLKRGFHKAIKELQEKEEQIQQGNKIIGLAEVKGPGIKITLKDNKKDIKNALNPSDLVVHDEDILSVINELKNAGAEAISINGQRIVPTTGIICGGNIIDINREKVGVPFVIEAIGLPEQLAALERPYGYLDILKGYGIEVKLERSNNITIPKYSGTLTYNYVKTIK